ncbi:MAG TPA: hypothetical protein VFG21_07890 [Xanthomonadaceae bacterium]|nr:hypothetical protein [Xanthomonadaceae bacterium]
MRSQSAMLLLCAAMFLPAAQAPAADAARLSANGSCPGATQTEATPDQADAGTGSDPGSGAPAVRSEAGKPNGNAPARARVRWQSFLPGMFK